MPYVKDPDSPFMKKWARMRGEKWVEPEKVPRLFLPLGHNIEPHCGACSSSAAYTYVYPRQAFYIEHESNDDFEGWV